jgi:S-ribosylhomocysteine lyase LuxS involved in autoinducer biosynthesis
MGCKTGGKLILKGTSREEDVLLFATAEGCRLDSAARFFEQL